MRNRIAVLTAVLACACAGPEPVAPPTGDSLIRQGDVFFRAKKYADALQRYAEARAVDPEDAEAWGRKGKVLLHLGRLDESLENSRKALELDPTVRDYDEIWRYIGSVLLLQNKPKNALSKFDEVMRANPLNYQALSARGTALLQLEHWKQAAEDFDRALEVRPNFAEARKKRETIPGLRRMKIKERRQYWKDWRQAVLTRQASP